LNDAKGKARISVPPASKGEIEIPIPRGTPEGTTLLVRVMNGSHEVSNATLWLGQQPPVRLHPATGRSTPLE